MTFDLPFWTRFETWECRCGALPCVFSPRTVTCMNGHVHTIEPIPKPGELPKSLRDGTL